MCRCGYWAACRDFALHSLVWVPGSAAQMMLVGRARERRNIVYSQVKLCGSRNLSTITSSAVRVVSGAEQARVLSASIGAWAACCVGVEVLQALRVGLRCFGCEGPTATLASAYRHPWCNPERAPQKQLHQLHMYPNHRCRIATNTHAAFPVFALIATRLTSLLQLAHRPVSYPRRSYACHSDLAQPRTTCICQANFVRRNHSPFTVTTTRT